METDISRLEDDKLVLLIGQKTDDQDVADRAWVELYRRHVRFVFTQVRRAGSLVGRGIDDEDVVVRVFEEVYLKAATEFRPGDYADADEARRHVLGWLGKITRHTFLKEIASRENEFWSVEEEPGVTTGGKSESCGDQDGSSNVLNITKNILTPDEFDIVWLKMQYYDVDSGESRLPTKDLEELCLKQRITKPTFRKRYERALAKVEDALIQAQVVSKP